MAAKLPQAITDMQLTAVRTLTSILSAPTLNSSVASSTATLTWTAPTPTGQSLIAGYRVYRGTSSGTINTLVGTFTALTTTDTLSGTQFYRVEAFDQYQTGISSNIISCAPVITGTLPAPQNVRLMQQGGPSNNLTNSQKIQWDLVSGATSYKVYRNSVFLNTVTAPTVTYTDNTATNSNFVGNEPTVTGPGTVYRYTVSAVNATGESPQSNQFYLWEYYQGTNFESGQFPFAYGIANANYAFAGANPPSGGNCIAIDWNPGLGGGLQIVGGPPLSTVFDLEVGAFNSLNFWVNTPNTANNLLISAHSRVPGGSFGPGDVFSFHQYSITQWIVNGPQVINTWQQYKVPFPALGLGVTNFTGYIAANVLTAVTVNNGVGTLGVDYAGIDNGGWITGPGVTKTYVNGLGSPAPAANGGPGKYTVANSQTVGSAAAPVAMTCARVNKYKQDLSMHDANPGGRILYADIGYTARTLLKHNPGFYGDGNTVISGSQDPVSRVGFEMNLAGNTNGCLGYCVFMTWGAFETAQDVYATAKLDALYNYLTTNFATPKRMSLILEVGAFTSTHPGTNDGSTLPLYLQQNPALYGQAGYREVGVTTQPANASGWWGGDGNGNTYCAQLHRASVMARFIKAVQAIAAWGDGKPYFEELIFGENSLWVGANSANGGGSGYSDTLATATQISLMQASAAAFPNTNYTYVNTYMFTETPAQTLTTTIVNNRGTPGQTDTMGRTRITNGGGLLSSWGVAAYAGQLTPASTATVTNWRDSGIHLHSEVQAPDLGAFGGISGGSAAQVPITFTVPALTGATSAVIQNPTSWPNGTGYVIRFSNNTTRSCTVANNHTATWTPGLSSDCTNAATVLEGGANGWTPQDLVDALIFEYKASHVYVAIIPDSATYVPIDRRWTQVSAVFLANPLTATSYPANL